MKVLYTITSSSPATGGAQIHLHQIAQQLSTHHTVNVAAFWNRNRTDWLLGTTVSADSPGHIVSVDGVPVHLLGWSAAQKATFLPAVALYYFFMPQIVPHIASLLLPQLEQIHPKPDLVHNVRIGREPLTWASMDFAHQKNIPFIFTPLHHPRWQGWRYRVYHQLYRQADALISLTNVEKEYLVSTGVREERVHVLGNGPTLAPQAHPEAFNQKFSLGSAPFVLFIGQHYSYKGYGQLLQSAPLVWQKIPETHFVFIGPPVHNSENHFKQLPDPRIHRLGMVDLQTKTDALAACSLLCVPSTQESFGGVYTEAWSFAKPVIGCPIPAVREVISNTEDGILVDQHPGPIADAIISLLTHPGLSSRLGSHGQQKVANHYSWPQLAVKLEKIYQSLL